MKWYKISPAVLTLLVFLLAQGVGTLLLIISGKAASLTYDTTFALILMAVDVIAVLGCYFLLRNIRLLTAADLPSVNWPTASIAIAAGILAALATSILTEGIPCPYIMEQMAIAMAHNPWGLITLTIIGPIAEELLFREGIEGEMLRRGASPWTAITVSAIAFSIAHFNLAQGLYALPLAIIFGIIYFKTGNIVLSAILHILNNSITALQMLTLEEAPAGLIPSAWFGGEYNAHIFMALSAALCIILIKLFWDKYQPRTPSPKNTLP